MAEVLQNLRSTRETELAEEYPLQVVCDWIGNSRPVAAKHYLQVTDEHFARAIGGQSEQSVQAAQNPAQKAHEETVVGWRHTSAIQNWAS